jgi:hypothetical protein
VDQCHTQPGLFNQLDPEKKRDEKETKRALDELFILARQYRTGSAYQDLMRFVAHFRYYSPYNAMLIHVQMPGATFVAPAHRWIRDYRRSIKPNARPLVILQPMGPVMFVFDVSDTEAGGESMHLPTDVERPFEVQKGVAGKHLETTIQNAERDGVRTHRRQEGSQSAGSIHMASGKQAPLKFPISGNRAPFPTFVDVPVRYELIINSMLSDEAQYATLVHELAHLYGGHVGTPNEKWWPDRQRLPHEAREFEAESVSYLICERLGIESPSAAYLAGYLKDKEPPEISLECVMKSTGLIEQMGQKRLKQRKADRGVD